MFMHIVKVTQSKDSVLRITYCKLQSEHFGCSQLFRANGSVCKMLNINLSHSTTEDILATSALLFTKNVCRGPNLVKIQVIIAFSVCYHIIRGRILTLALLSGGDRAASVKLFHRVVSVCAAGAHLHGLVTV